MLKEVVTQGLALRQRRYRRCGVKFTILFAVQVHPTCTLPATCTKTSYCQGAVHRRPKNFSPHPKRGYNMKFYFRSLFCCVWTPADNSAVCSVCCQLSIPHKNTPGTMEPTAAQTKKKNYVTTLPIYIYLLVNPQHVWRSALACTPQSASAACNRRVYLAVDAMPATVRSQKPPYIGGFCDLQIIFFLQAGFKYIYLNPAFFFYPPLTPTLRPAYRRLAAGVSLAPGCCWPSWSPAAPHCHRRPLGRTLKIIQRYR